MPQLGQSAQTPGNPAGKGFDMSESDSSLNQCLGVDRKKHMTFVRVLLRVRLFVVKGCLFDGLPHPVEALGGGAQAELSPGVEAVGAGTQSGLQLLESDVSGVAADGGETPDSAGEVGVSFPTGYTGGEEQAAPLLGPDTVGVWSRGEPPLLVAAATTVSVVKEGSVPRVCVTPLLAKAGVDSKEAEGRAGCV
ncbi:uncharacterized protein LOC135104907 [Scylla paramamosain]|uniref:uncharacterized protein LOC135104907 n=1 Tax=Scylla paramamosain TaxID=85552 RepID=UPI003083E92E